MSKNYLVNVAAALTGQEGFQMTTAEQSQLYGASVTLIVIYAVIMLLFSLGAARLSYTYNMSIGTSGGFTWLYAVLSFIFSSLYYPYYAFVLNPVGAVQKGGKRR